MKIGIQRRDEGGEWCLGFWITRELKEDVWHYEVCLWFLTVQIMVEW